MDEKCTAWMKFSHRYGPCGRDAEGHLTNGKPACALHLAAERKRAESEQKWRQEWEDSDAFREQVAEFCERKGLELNAKRPDMVEIKFADLVDLYEELEGYRGR